MSEGILSWIVLGLIIGLLARWVVPGTAPGGWVADGVVGMVGALIGGWLYSRLGHVDMMGIYLPSLVCAFIGAVVLLWLLRAIAGRITV